MAIRTFGTNAVDWEVRTDLDGLREARPTSSMTVCCPSTTPRR